MPFNKITGKHERKMSGKKKVEWRIAVKVVNDHHDTLIQGEVQLRSDSVLDSRPRGRRFEPHWHHCVVSLSKNINPSLVLVQPRKTRPCLTERLFMGRKEAN